MKKIAFGLVGLFLFSGCGEPTIEEMACTSAQYDISQQMKSPSSAKFPEGCRVTVKEENTVVWAKTLAKNPMGVELQSDRFVIYDNKSGEVESSGDIEGIEESYIHALEVLKEAEGNMNIPSMQSMIDEMKKSWIELKEAHAIPIEKYPL